MAMGGLNLAPWPALFLLCIGTYSIEVNEQGSQLPTFTWLDSHNISVLFPNGIEDTIKLWEVEKFGNLVVPCLYEGKLMSDNSSSVAVSGCQYDPVVNIVMYAKNLVGHNMFNIINGTIEEVEKIAFGRNNADSMKTKERRLKKRGAYIADDAEDYDEVVFDGSVTPEPPAFLSLDIRLAFEQSLLTEKVTEVAAREYIARVFTLGKQHLQHSTLGSKIRLRAQGPIRRIPGKSWVPNEANLREAKDYKDPEEVPITFFCYNQDRDNDTGISFLRRACHEQKGVSIVAAREDINKAAQTYAHECGHWLGLPHDAEEDEDKDSNCEGTGLMSSALMEGGRPAAWSNCNARRFRKWYHKNDRMYSHCLKDDEEVLQLENSCLAASYENVVASNPKCDTIIVAGADYANCNGKYKLSPEKVPWMPSRPVYAHVSLDRYIYWNARGHGWSIGSKEDMRNGGYYHYSGLDSLEPWEAAWRNGITVRCQLGVVLLESEGYASEHDGHVMGYFDELAEKLNERPTYGQRGGGGDVFMYYDGVDDWWVGKTLGAARGWLYARSDSLLPPTSGWFFAANGSFHDAAGNDTSLKLTQNPSDLGNCSNINITATGPAGIKYKEHLGLYEWMSGEMLSGKKLYHNGHAYLRVRTDKTAWSTGLLKDSWLSPGGLTSGKATSCPCSKNAGPTTRFDRDWWAYYDNNEYIVDMSITVTCV